jgi:pimeloyl-ACP methyl ester carboxylesterase
MMAFINIAGRLHETTIVRPKQQLTTGTAYLLLHEGLGCVELWKGFPELLANASGCDVVAYSRGGYGKSSPVELPRSLDYMTEEAEVWLPQLIQQLNYERIILVGHSDGGSIALIYAGTSNDGKLAGVITLAAHVFNEPICVAGIQQAKQAYQQGKLRQGLALYHGDNVDCAFWGWNDVWLNPAFLNFNIEAYLNNIQVPLLVVQGEDDEYGTLAQVESIVLQAGGYAEALVIPSCKHSIHRQASDQLILAICKFTEQKLQIN